MIPGLLRAILREASASLPFSRSQAGQRVGSRQIDDRIAGSRERVMLTGRYNLVYSGKGLLFF